MAKSKKQFKCEKCGKEYATEAWLKRHKCTLKSSEKNSDSSKDKRLKNLKPFKPGQSGNPKGKPKGLLDFKTRLKMAIDVLAVKFAEDYNKKYAKQIKDGLKVEMKSKDVDILGDVFMQYVNKARNGDLKAMDSIFDRTYGKAKQPVELGGLNGEPIKHEVVVKEQAKKAKSFVDKWLSKKK